MATSVLKTRIQHKYDTPANWAKATTFVPLKGELCIFNNGSGAKPEMKIGDGTTALASLPFLKAGGDVAVSRSLTSGTKIATITVDGVATDLYCETNTDTNTTYSAGTGLSLSGTTFSQVARTFTIGNGSFSYDGSADVSLATHNIFTSFTSDTTISWDDLPVGFTEMSGSNEAAWSGTNNPSEADGFYRWGGALTLNRGGTGAFAQIYISHQSSASNGILYRSGWYTDKKPWVRILDSNTYTAYTVTKTGGGASGTWGINITGSSASCTGNAATATKWATARTITLGGDLSGSVSLDGSTNITLTATVTDDSHNHTFLILKGVNTISSTTDDTTANWVTYKNSIHWYNTTGLLTDQPSQWGYLMNFGSINEEVQQLWLKATGGVYYRGGNSSGWGQSWKKLWQNGDSITGAVWNDYAEYRESSCAEFGRVLIENGDDTLSPSTERLQPFAGISSDTWGFCQGETDRAKTPIAVAGRVLAYPYRNRNEYKPGDCLCAAPNGTVDIMTREEVERYPDRIVGTVSCVPQYEEWGQGDRPAVKVDGRIWVKVR